ncbi:hypothetical protein A2U01_0076565, partial [Trifolium medium]|nr:hypothetical protein [Trifolium medium]
WIFAFCLSLRRRDEGCLGRWRVAAPPLHYLVLSQPVRDWVSLPYYVWVSCWWPRAVVRHREQLQAL